MSPHKLTRDYYLTEHPKIFHTFTELSLVTQTSVKGFYILKQKQGYTPDDNPGLVHDAAIPLLSTNEMTLYRHYHMDILYESNYATGFVLRRDKHC